MTYYNGDDLIDPLIPSGVFFVKVKERLLITFVFIVPSLMDCGTSFST